MFKNEYSGLYISANSTKFTVSVGVVNNRIESLIGPLPEYHRRCAPEEEVISDGNDPQIDRLLVEGKHASSDEHIAGHLE